MIIYKVINIINNKIYIGQTIHSLNIRKSQHERSHEYGYKTAFSNAIKKYGKENFIWEIIYETDYLDEENKVIEPKNAACVKAKKVKNLDTGEIFENATLAEFHYQGYKSGNLSKACTGKNKTFAGYRWKYV